jgi:hypothetical protein
MWRVSAMVLTRAGVAVGRRGAAWRAKVDCAAQHMLTTAASPARWLASACPAAGSACGCTPPLWTRGTAAAPAAARPGCSPAPCVCVRVCACLCVFVCARARVCVCVCAMHRQWGWRDCTPVNGQAHASKVVRARASRQRAAGGGGPSHSTPSAPPPGTTTHGNTHDTRHTRTSSRWRGRRCRHPAAAPGRGTRE